MRAFTCLTGPALVLAQENIDTDQIIPARFLTATDFEGMGEHAFADWRYGADGEKYQKGWGAYEHLPPAKWPSMLGENYRRCCTSVAWVGQALAARILHAEEAWNHDAFFDYVDRWMEEDDTEATRTLKTATGRDYSASFNRQRQAWDPFVNKMWAEYRHNLPPEPVAE